MTRISYDTSSANARRMLHTLIPCLSHLIAPAAELCVKFDISTLLTRASLLMLCCTISGSLCSCAHVLHSSATAVLFSQIAVSTCEQ